MIQKPRLLSTRLLSARLLSTMVVLLCTAGLAVVAADTAPAAGAQKRAKPAAARSAKKPKPAPQPPRQQPAAETAGAAQAAAANAQGTLAPVDPATAARLASFRQAAVDAYNGRNWAAAAAAAQEYRKAVEEAGLPNAGVDFALVEFIGGHSRYELWKADPHTFQYDYDKDVLEPMEASLKIVQDDLFFKHNALGNAYFEKLKAQHFHDLPTENAASWHMLRALTARQEELQQQGKALDSEEYTAFAKYVLQYIARSFEMARWSAAPNVYLRRVREACRLGFGTRYDARFAQLFQVIGFDDGNVRAGVLWQTGLDMMQAEGSKPEEVLDILKQAAQATHGNHERAEVYRQMADFASRQDGYNYKLAAVEFGRQAYSLDPNNKDVQLQYGTSLHVISYAQFNSGKFEDALRAAKEATAFPWEGDEVAYFDLSRAEANFGDKINALTHAETAYDKARRKYKPEEQVPFRQNYANILRQFGLSARATQVEADGHGS